MAFGTKTFIRKGYYQDSPEPTESHKERIAGRIGY
jgi:hypothetical protein